MRIGRRRGDVDLHVDGAVAPPVDVLAGTAPKRLVEGAAKAMVRKCVHHEGIRRSHLEHHPFSLRLSFHQVLRLRGYQRDPRVLEKIRIGRIFE